ncbi:hypothetical protein FQN55_007214 [Onygenales sp. PD_40]|nr:hypothetical protein FQN55_007214 [Onygenales sp. PD_40]
MSPHDPPISTESLLMEHQESHDDNETVNRNKNDRFELRSLAPPPSTTSKNNAGYHLTRFYTRALVAVFVPLVVTVYYIALWTFVNKREADIVKYGLPGEVWLFYSWFVVGVFGLNLSRYALLGVEAAMLQESFWQVNSTMAILMHCGASWSGPGGWFKAVKGVFRRERRVAHRLWFTLAFLSLLASVALPLSGLSFELGDGYVKTGEPPMVVGRTWEDFNLRVAFEALIRGLDSWKDGAATTLPGHGVGYTPPDFDRMAHPFLSSFPNSLPIGGGEMTDIFLTPQAQVPINGRAWGLRLGYNCSIVRSASELTIVSEKGLSRFVNDQEEWSLRLEDTKPLLWLRTPTEDTIAIYNTTERDSILYAYVEIGSSKNEMYNDSYTGTVDGGAPRVQLSEYVVWQVVQIGDIPDTSKFNYSIQDPITGLGHPVTWDPSTGEYSSNKTFLTTLNGDGDTARYGMIAGLSDDPVDASIQPIAAPIGVRCLRTSAFGHSDISAQGTYTSFTESRTPPIEGDYGLLVFGSLSNSMLWGRFLEHFRAAHAPLPPASNSGTYYPGFLQANTLLQSISQAHAVEALQLMYDGAAFSDIAAYSLANTTSARVDKIIILGTVPAALPAVLFAIWAFGSALLGALYGFRRRWSEVLDGYSMFRFGADYADEIRDQPDFSSIRQFDKCDALRRLPGLVGDSRVREKVGHISLVKRGNLVDREKMYI